MSHLPAIVDELAAIKAQIAVLEAREKELSRELIATGLGEVCGTDTRAKIVTVAPGVTVDWKGVAQTFHPADELLEQFTKPKAGSTSVRLYGYN